MQKSFKVQFNRQDGGEFFTELKRAVESYFSEKDVNAHANTLMWVKTLAIVALGFGSYGLILFTGWPLLVKWGLTVFMGAMFASFGMAIGHDAMHGALSRSRKVNRFMGLLMDIGGFSSYLWFFGHNIHHTYTNIHGADTDIEGRGPLRFSPFAQYKKVHRYQHLYAFLLYPLIYMNMVFYLNFRQYYNSEVGPYTAVKHPKGELLKMVFFKVLFVAYTLVVPGLLLEVAWWQLLLGWVTFMGTTGLLLAIIFMMAHVVEGISYPMPNEEGQLGRGWAVHQMATTANFGTRNVLLTWYCGGLNHQVEHHLFPNICHIHYPALRRIVKPIAEKHGVPYQEVKGFWKGLGQHYRMLKQLGQPNAHLQFG